MKKNDIFLIIIALIILIPIAIFFLTKENGNKAIVKINGETVDTLNLNKDGFYTYDSEYGQNIVEVKDGKVRVSEADCPGQDCVSKGFVKRNNESVICLPHKFEVFVVNDKDDYDLIVE